MRIVFNRNLRELKKFLKSKKYKCPDFIFDGYILRITNDKREQRTILMALLKYDITSEQYNFMLDVYQNDKESYDMLLQIFGINNHINISAEFIQLYKEDKPACFELIKLQQKNKDKNYLNRKLYDFLGKEVFMANLDMLDELSIEKLSPYIEEIKKNPSALKSINKLLDSQYQYLEKLMPIIHKNNFNEIVEILLKLKSEPLINALLDNLENNELLEFSKKVIGECNGKLYGYEYGKKVDYNTMTFINDFLRCSPYPLSIELVEKLNFENLKVYKSSRTIEEIRLIALASTVGIQFNNLDKLISIIKQAESQNFPLSEEVQKVSKIVEQFYKDTLTIEEILQLMEHYLTDRSARADYNEVLKWVKEFKSYELNQGLIDPKKLTPYKYQNYSFVGKDGNIRMVNIPIIKIDDPNFKALMHTINIKTKKTSPHNYQLTQQLINNPSLWGMVIEGGNPNISMSLAHKNINSFSTGVKSIMLGFSNIEGERLISTHSSDGATPMDNEKNEQLNKTRVETQAIYFENYLHMLNNDYTPGAITKFFKYNEVLSMRYLENETKKPDYILMVTGLDIIYPMEVIYNWAAYFGIPIVEIDGLALKKYHSERYQQLLEDIEKSPILTNLAVRTLFEERKLIFDYSKRDEKTPTFYDTFCAILNNKDLNVMENAETILHIIEIFNGSGEWYNYGYNLVTEIDKKTALLRKEKIQLIRKRCETTIQQINQNSMNDNIEDLDAKSR